jgi:hypothetical protein
MSTTLTFKGMLKGLGLFFFMAKDLMVLPELGYDRMYVNLLSYGVNVKLMLKFFLKKSKN